MKTVAQMQQDLLNRMDFDQYMKFNEWIVKEMEVIQKK